VAFTLLYHAEVKEDTRQLDERLKKRIKTAIENRLTTAPHQYGEPLRKTLKGYWKLRVGDYRVVYKIIGNEVRILGISHRKEVYEKIEKRVG
jgi:mRNA interferase RelE/StbE